jgi:hypothetical protein
MAETTRSGWSHTHRATNRIKPKLNDRDLNQSSHNPGSKKPATKIAPEYKGTRKSYPPKFNLLL